MTHHRNFYFEKVSSRTTLGGNTPPGPHYAQTQRDTNVVLFPLALSPPGAMENLPDGAETVRSFIKDEREFAATCFVAGMAAAIGFTMFVLTFFAFTIFDFG